MKIRVSTFAAALLMLLIFPAAAGAHFFINDDDIKALVHIDPEHQPVTGEPATISYDISKRNGRLKLSDYDVTIKAEANSEIIPLTPKISGSNSLTASTVFTRPGVYKITLVASAKHRLADFFKLQFIQRVEGSRLKSDSSRAYWIRLSLFGSLVGCALIAAGDMISQRFKNKTSKEIE